MQDESSLREKAREAVRTNALPNHRPDRIWGGPAPGQRCQICGATMKRDEAALELEYLDAPTVHVHPTCFSAWEEERERARENEGGPGPPADKMVAE